MTPSDAVLLAVYFVGTVIVVGIYIEQMFFIRKHFSLTTAERRRRTMWLLALFPVNNHLVYMLNS